MKLKSITLKSAWNIRSIRGSIRWKVAIIPPESIRIDSVIQSMSSCLFDFHFYTKKKEKKEKEKAAADLHIHHLHIELPHRRISLNRSSASGMRQWRGQVTWFSFITNRFISVTFPLPLILILFAYFQSDRITINDGAAPLSSTGQWRSQSSFSAVVFSHWHSLQFQSSYRAVTSATGIFSAVAFFHWQNSVQFGGKGVFHWHTV